MLVGVAHVHFRGGERGPQEATLDFDDAVGYLERQGMRELVATFHLRHPVDLRPATPQALLNSIAHYIGLLDISVMPEANVVYARDGNRTMISTDIDAHFAGRFKSYIVAAHFTAQLGWSKSVDEERAVEQSFTFMTGAYAQVMLEEWAGWIGHPFQWCSGGDREAAMRTLLRGAIETRRAIEISVKPIRRHTQLTVDKARALIPMFRPEIIAEFATDVTRTGLPQVVISVDAHHLDDLKAGCEKAGIIADWLVAGGVQPAQIWAYNAQSNANE